MSAADPVAPAAYQKPVDLMKQAVAELAQASAPAAAGVPAQRPVQLLSASLPPRKMRAAVILVATAVIATLGWVGVYLMAFSSGDAAADVAARNSVPVGVTPGGSADFVIDPKTGKKMSMGARARAAAAKLPKGELTQEQKRIALQNYTLAIGLDLSNAASPTTAARSACRMLGTGTEPEDLVTGVARGGRIAKAQSRAFLLGATLLYCPSESKAFVRPPKR
jgi:hypothetical protein